MRSFACDVCDALVFFENSRCLISDTPLGFSPSEFRMVALVQDGGQAYRTPGGAVERRCSNFGVIGCNWLVATDAGGPLCRCCELTRTRPSDTDVVGMAQWEAAERAKRRLVYQLVDLGLPVLPLSRDPGRGVAFDLLSSTVAPVITGHADGVVTIDLAEGDDSHRESMRVQLDEPYRTVLGHLRHETGHYYWTLLVDRTPALQEFRDLFGDERADYGEALQRHYDRGAPEGWEERYVSAYATMHPWEDWAETFAHYLHQRDTLQTAAAAGIVVGGPHAAPAGVEDPARGPLASVPTDEVDTVQDLIATWLPLTYALNAVNRSMGKDDLYPFVLSPTVMDKLGLVHRQVRAARPAPVAAG